MLLHNFRIAWKSLRRSTGLSALLVAGIALGIAVATTFAAVRHSFARDPIPGKSSVLRYVRLDSWDPSRAYPGTDRNPLPPQITYQDMVGLMRSTVPVRQSGMYITGLYVYPPAEVARPSQEIVRVCFADFFPMFDVPFRYGAGWSRTDDAKGEQVVVLSSRMNDRLFGGRNSVGKTVRISDRDFRVVGVMDRWVPSVRFYDLTQNAAALPEDVYIPFSLIRPMELRPFGNSDAWGPSPTTPGVEGNLQGERVFIQMWVELPDEAAAARYRDFLHGYIAEQKRRGRFQRPENFRLSTVPELMRDFHVVPKEIETLLVVSLLFLGVCAVNLVGLLLAKFLARAPEIGVRRALGASRLDVFLQHVVECELIGFLGGVAGLVLSAATLVLVNQLLKASTRADFFALDPPMIALSVLLSLLAGLVAGVYPAWRICRVAPAIHLKLQ